MSPVFYIALSLAPWGIAPGPGGADGDVWRVAREPVVQHALVSVTVTGLEHDVGSVRVALFDDPEGFTENAAFAAVVPPEGRSASWTFRVPYGTYAVAVVHDEDDNGRLNTNLFGMPRERYGFSNGARGTFGPPSFDDASFEVGEPRVAVPVLVR
jgi:uncharacterized protein (DUF2141 family)